MGLALAQPEMNTQPTFEPAAPLLTPEPSSQLERTVRLTVRDDGIGVLTFDRPNSSANLLDLRTLDELDEELAFLERQTQLGHGHRFAQHRGNAWILIHEFDDIGGIEHEEL